MRARPWCRKAPTSSKIRAAPRRACGSKTDGRIVVLLPGPAARIESHVHASRSSRVWRGSPAACACIAANCASPACPNPTSTSASRRFTRATPTWKRRFSPRRAKFRFICAAGPATPPPPKKMLDEMVEALDAGAGRKRLHRQRRIAGRSRGARTDVQPRHHRRRRKLHGGLLAERLTRIPGSSAYFLGGVVCYSNDLKTAWADVPAGTDRIARRGQRGSGARARRRNSPRTGATLASASPASPGPAAARRKNPSAWCTSPSPTRRAARNAPCTPRRSRPHPLASLAAALDMVRRYLLYAGSGRLARAASARARNPREVRGAFGDRPRRLPDCARSARWTRPAGCNQSETIGAFRAGIAVRYGRRAHHAETHRRDAAGSAPQIAALEYSATEIPRRIAPVEGAAEPSHRTRPPRRNSSRALT